jgi:cell volume regulation protein A
LPRWARPVLVVREQEILQPVEAGPLRAGDYAYFLAPPDRASRLDQLFGHGEEGAGALEPIFPLVGATPVARLIDLYGVDFPESDRALTIADLFAKRFEDRPEVGDRIAIGENLIISALEMDEERVVRAGLMIEDHAAPGAPVQAGQPKSWLRRLFHRIAQRRE